MTTLDRIRTKVRRLTGSPSANQLTDTEIDLYVNDFYQLDFPEHLRLRELHTNFTLFLQPNVNLYAWDRNLFINVEQPIYINGQLARFTESQTEFYMWWPKNQINSNAATGDGVSVSYSFVLPNVPILRGQFSVSAILLDGTQQTIQDRSGAIGDTAALGTGGGTINYITGACTAVFSQAVQDGTNIVVNYSSYTSGWPTTVLLYNNPESNPSSPQFDVPGSVYPKNFSFIDVRPVPNTAYSMEMQVWFRPTPLTAPSDSPLLNEWWQLLAVGAAKKVLEDRLDMDTVEKLLPLYQEQMGICMNRTAVENAQARASTIYSEMWNTAGPFGWNNGVQ